MKLNLSEKDNILELFNNANIDRENELEIVFNSINRTYKQNISITDTEISRIQFTNVFKRLENLYGHPEEHPAVLDILSNNHPSIRTSLSGVANIQYYCKKNILEKEKLEFLKKINVKDNKNNFIKPLYINEYNFKIKLKKEIVLEDEENKKKILSDIDKFKKYYRFKKRYSFKTPDNLFEIDLTIIKSSNRKKNGDFESYNSVKDSKLLTNNEEYEIELEYIGNKNKSLEETVLNIYNQFLKYSGEIIQVLQNNSYLISSEEKSTVLNNYLKLIDHRISIGKINVNNNYFIGPKVVSLNLSNIRDNELIKLKNINTIRKGYCVTEKTDGERCLIFIDNDGKVYIINDRLYIKYTGIVNKLHSNCILDGEHVTKTKHGLNINHVLIFDIYFKDGKDIRKLPFKNSENKKGESGRIDLAKDIFEKSMPPKDFNFKIKNFKYGSIDKYSTKIFEVSEEIWNLVNQNNYPYNVDGLIYTPLLPLTDMIDDRNRSDLFYSRRTWNKLLKWKPSIDNTIDFLVKIEKDNNNQDKISYTLDNGQIRKYKTLILYTGFNSNNSRVPNPGNLIYKNQSIYKEIREEYKAMEFQPYGVNQYLAHVFLEMINGKEVLTTLKKDGEIKDNMIIEMCFDINKESNWRWVPRNIRFDKTEKAREPNSTVFGNDFKTALSIWNSYSLPINENMLFNKEPIPDENKEDEVYYANSTSKISRNNSKTIMLRKFHNSIKDFLIKDSSNLFKEPFVLDLGCGQGGDLHKFKFAKISKYLGIDIYLDNLISPDSGAYKRYSELKKNDNNLFDAYFIYGDVGQNIRNGDFILGNDDNYRKVFNVLYGNDPKYKNSNELQDNVYGIFENGFDIINIQFAIHYLFKNREILDRFITNIVENIKLNGLFIGTTYDGHRVFDLLKDKKKDEFVIGYDNDKTPIWRIKKEYDTDTFEDSEHSLGLPISVIMDSIGTENTEYLVNFNYLKTILEKNDITLLDEEECKSLSLPVGREGYSTGLFADVYENDLKGQAKFPLSDPEKKVSFLNRWFIFQKKKEKLGKIKIKIERTPRKKKQEN